MSSYNQKNSYNLFTTPIDDLYNEIDHGHMNDSFGNLEGLINGLNSMMKENEANKDSDLSFLNINDDVSTKASSPFEKNFLHNKSENFAFHSDTAYQSIKLKNHVCLKGKKFNFSRCLKKNWKTKIFGFKDNLKKYYIANIISLNQKFSTNFENIKAMHILNQTGYINKNQVLSKDPVYEVNSTKTNFINEFVNFNFEIILKKKKENLKNLMDYFNLKHFSDNNYINKLQFNRNNSLKAFYESQRHDLIKLSMKTNNKSLMSRGKLEY